METKVFDGILIEKVTFQGYIPLSLIPVQGGIWYSAPIVVGLSGYMIGAKRHAFRLRARGASGATVLVLAQARAGFDSIP